MRSQFFLSLAVVVVSLVARRAESVATQNLPTGEDCVWDTTTNGSFWSSTRGQEVAGDNDLDPTDKAANGGQLKRLTCHLTTIQSGPTVIPQVDKAEVLQLKCSDLFLYESILRPDQFGSLGRLQHLSLESCKIRQVPDGTFLGLRRLLTLSLRGHNSAWSGAMTMQLSADSLLGLEKLTQLDLSDNNVWGLPVSTLCHTQQLRALNLSHNNIVEVSEIGLTDNRNGGGQQQTAVSVNNEQTTGQAGAGRSGCQLLHLTTLDLSYNRISSFLPRDLSLAPGLRHLILRGNRLSVLSDQSLTGLWSLTSLDLADNRLSALPPALFHQANRLERLLLQNNSLSSSSLSADVFHGLDNLLLLNISRNGLVSQGLGEDTFSGLQKLMALDLSHNRLTHLPNGLLSAQNGLQILNLQHNRLTVLKADDLANLVNLHIFLVSHNRLEAIGPNAFDAMASLSSLSLDHNRLTSLPTGVLTEAMSASLHDLALNNNQLDRIPEDIGRLARLRTLDLGENRIVKLELDGGHNNDLGVLANITGLYGLRLAGNRLTRIGSQALANNANLHVLNLAHNRLEQIDTAALRNLRNLRALRLDNNRLTDINGLVSGAKQLQWLNVSANRLAWFDFAFVPKSLEWLDIHDNAVDRIGNYYGLDGEDGFALRTFDASHNQIRELGGPDVLALSSLRNIYLNNNRIREIKPDTFSRLGNLTRVELQGNQLVRMEMSALAVTNKGSTPEFLLGGNPWECDCSMQWLKTINAPANRVGFPRVVDLDAVLCRVVGSDRHQQLHSGVTIGNNATGSAAAPTISSSKVKGALTSASSSQLVLPLLQMKNNQFMCEYSAHCIPQCFCCDFFACDCRMQCPDGCSCYHDNSWSHNIVVCSDRGHLDVPPLIPMDATAVYLDGNNMTSLDNPGFIGRRRIRAVYLNNSNIRAVTNFSFEGLTEVRVLHLEDNKIERLEGNEFLGLDHLKELYLHNNYLTEIAEATFRGLTQLAVLRLDGNLLSSFPVWQLASNQMLVGLYLAGNLWSCDCDFVVPFQAFTATSIAGGGGHKVVDLTDIRCVADRYRMAAGGRRRFGDGSGVDQAIASMDSIDCRAESLMQASSRNGAGKDNNNYLDYTPILVSVLLTVLVFVIGYIVAFAFRRNIKAWLADSRVMGGAFKALNRRRPGSSNNTTNSTGLYSMAATGKNDGKLFDVFVSYSAADREFVETGFVANLEQRRSNSVVGNNNSNAGGNNNTAAYRLCLHQRDFPAGSPVHDTIAVAVESSARALIVLSRSYLATEWTSVGPPFLEAVRTNNTKVIFVQLEDVVSPTTTMDNNNRSSTPAALSDDCGATDLSSLSAHPQLRQLLETSPVVHWSDPGFWTKLRYYLPEPVYLTFHRNVTMRGTMQSTSNLYQPVTGGGAGTASTNNFVMAANTTVLTALGSPLSAVMSQYSGQQQPETSMTSFHQVGVGNVSNGGIFYQHNGGGSLYASSEHTYHTIDNNHIYHTLDPNSHSESQTPQQHQQQQSDAAAGIIHPHQLLLNRNVGLLSPQGQLSVIGPPYFAVVNPNSDSGDDMEFQVVEDNQRRYSQSHTQQATAARLVAHSHHQHQQPPQPQQQFVGQVRVSHSAPVTHNNSGIQHINHAHTSSTSSAKRLLSGEDAEYIV